MEVLDIIHISSKFDGYYQPRQNGKSRMQEHINIKEIARRVEGNVGIVSLDNKDVTPTEMYPTLFGYTPHYHADTIVIDEAVTLSPEDMERLPDQIGRAPILSLPSSVTEQQILSILGPPSPAIPVQSEDNTSTEHDAINIDARCIELQRKTPIRNTDIRISGIEDYDTGITGVLCFTTCSSTKVDDYHSVIHINIKDSKYKKECPFCGSKEILLNIETNSLSLQCNSYVYCTGCRAKGPAVKNSFLSRSSFVMFFCINQPTPDGALNRLVRSTSDALKLWTGKIPTRIPREKFPVTKGPFIARPISSKDNYEK